MTPQSGSLMWKLMLSLFAVLLFTTVALVAISYWRFSNSMRVESKAVVRSAGPQGLVITEEMLRELPEPAQRYFRWTGVLGKVVPRTVELSQRGRIRNATDAAWTKLEAAQTYAVTPPAFVWRAWFPSKALPLVLGRDTYGAGQGSILMKMLSFTTVADESGPEMGPAGLMRFLNEMMWFPTAYFTPYVLISEADDTSFDVRLTDGGDTVSGRVHVDTEGRMTNFSARRFNTATGTMEQWETPMTGYGSFEGLNVPISGSAVWKLPDGDFTYIELEVSGIRYQR